MGVAGTVPYNRASRARSSADRAGLRTRFPDALWHKRETPSETDRVFRFLEASWVTNDSAGFHLVHVRAGHSGDMHTLALPVLRW